MKSKMHRIAWKLVIYDPSVASARYRCYKPVAGLVDFGFNSRIYSGTDPIDLTEDLAALIFVKSFLDSDVTAAREAHRRGIPVIIDLCDNIFYRAERDFPTAKLAERGLKQVSNLRAMAKFTTLIITTGTELAQIINRELGQAIPVAIVPDGVETAADFESALVLRRKAQIESLTGHGFFWFLALGLPRLMGALKVAITKAFVGLLEFTASFTSSAFQACMKFIASYLCRFNERAQYLYNIWSVGDSRYYRSQEPAALTAVGANDKILDLPQILWFGISGQRGLYGITDILDIYSELRQVFATKPFSLTVVTNSREDFDSVISHFSFPTRFVEWSSSALANELKKSAVVIIPNPMNDFTSCKSANRALLALTSGVPVVATKTSALSPLRGAIRFNSWVDNLILYLTDKLQAEADIRRAGQIIQSEFADVAIAEKWAETLRPVLRDRSTL